MSDKQGNIEGFSDDLGGAGIGLQDGTTNVVDVRAKAMDLLARREHSRHELTAKLNRRGYDEAVITAVLDELVEHDWLSDWRYAEAYLWMRSAKGYGPLRIRNELSERGVASELVAAAFAQTELDWFEHARQVRKRKFGTYALSVSPEADKTDDRAEYKTRAKQSRFLQYRGFDYEQIHYAFEVAE